MKDVDIGDVEVADTMYGYESGKEDDTGFHPRPEVKNAAHDIEQRGRTLPKSDDWKTRLNPDIQHSEPQGAYWANCRWLCFGAEVGSRSCSPAAD